MKTRNSKLKKTELTSILSPIVLIAAVMVLNTKAIATEKVIRLNPGTDAFNEVLASEGDAKMNIEKWMLNESNFSHTYKLETANDASLKMENWMTDANMFNAAYYLETEAEKVLDVAEWMKNESNFFPSFSFETEKEDALELENWMMKNESLYSVYPWLYETEEELNVEEWMLIENTFYTSSAFETGLDNLLELEAWMLNDTTFHKVSSETVKTEVLAMASAEQAEHITTIEYKDAISGVTFLFRLAEAKEPELQLENWMLDKKYWNRKLSTK